MGIVDRERSDRREDRPDDGRYFSRWRAGRGRTRDGGLTDGADEGWHERIACAGDRANGSFRIRTGREHRRGRGAAQRARRARPGAGRRHGSRAADARRAGPRCSLCDRVVDITLIPETARNPAEGDRVVIGAGAIVQRDHRLAPRPRDRARCWSKRATRSARRRSATWGRSAATWRMPPRAPTRCPRWSASTRSRTPSPPPGRWSGRSPTLVMRPNQTKLPRGRAADGAELPWRRQTGSRSVFLKLGRRNAMAISRLTVAALGRLGRSRQGGRSPARARLGHAADPAFPAAEALLLGQTPTFDAVRGGGAGCGAGNDRDHRQALVERIQGAGAAVRW